MPAASARTPGAKPRLYHAPSSYYSAIARLALAEAGLAYEPVVVDILFRMSQQQPDYARLNSNMTVPTLVLPGRVLDQSRDIAEFAYGLDDGMLDAATRTWLDLHYGYPIEELTFGHLLSRNPFARWFIPRQLAASHRRLLALAEANPDLADAYRTRAAVFAGRAAVFDSKKVVEVAERRRAEAIGLMDRLDSALADGRAVLVPPAYGIVDTIWTVFLARANFVGLGTEIAKRPQLVAYWRAMQARPSFTAADVWTRLHPLRMLGGFLGLAKR
ncbi:MAG TPA: glutathione S-transferase family protein [Pseudolabrys sp.]|nr:glutathione S-transferase family protein [Pseudolabrys sp.]